MDTKIVSISSCKGGQGKSSLSLNLAYELVQTGKRVLAVDFDPQSNLTISVGLNPAEDRAIIYDAMLAPGTAPDTVVRLDNGIHLLPAGPNLVLSEQSFAGHYDRNDKLKHALAALTPSYDFIVIDTPPSLGFFAFAALTAATEVLIPLQPHPFAYKMINPTMTLIESVRRAHTSLSVRAIVLSMYDRRVSLSGSVEEAARGTYGELVAQTIIPQNIAIAESTLDGVPVAVYSPNSAGALAYKELTRELYG